MKLPLSLLPITLSAAMALPLSAKAPLIVDDLQIIKSFEEKAGVFAEGEEVPRVKELQKALQKPSGLSFKLGGEAPQRVEDAIYTLAAVYDCGKCDKWHSSGFTTAWVVGSEGIFCTNHHVIEAMKGEIAAVSSAKGEVYPVLEVLLVDEANDIAVFRVDASGLPALSLASEPAEVGEAIRCVGHPDRRFYTHTLGEVSRYYYNRTPNKDGVRVPFMAITADYARGSSGGPILNAKNEVVGMVSNTYNIYYGRKGQKNADTLQMVIKNCVPGFKIEELLAKGPSVTKVEEVVLPLADSAE